MEKSRGDEEGSYFSHHQNQQVMDGHGIIGLVENKEVFRKFVEDRFRQLDSDRDGKLSVEELQPALAEIGAVLDLPPPGTSPESDTIYSQVLDEFTHGKEDKVSKTKFEQVLSDILLGVADGLKRDPIEMRRMDGQALSNFLNSSFEMEVAGIFSRLDATQGSLSDYIAKGLEQLTFDQGMPPSSDPWVKSNIVGPALRHCLMDAREGPITQAMFEAEFKEVVESIAKKLKAQPVVVAHTEKTFDGNSIRGLLSNKSELDKCLDVAAAELPKDRRHHRLSKEYLIVAFDSMAPAAGLPPYGAVYQVDELVNEALKLVKADDPKLVDENEFKKLLLEILGSLMLQLQEKPISISSNSVVHEPPDVSTTSFLVPTTSAY